VTAATVWSNYAASTHVDDILSWIDVYVDTNGYAPGSIQMSTTVFRHLQKSEQIIGLAFPNGTVNVARVKASVVREILLDEGIPPIELFDARAINAAGTTARITPEDKILFLPPAGVQLGSTLWGVTLEAQEAEYGIAAGAQAGLVVGAFKQKTTPIRVYTIGSAIGIPIVGNPDATFVADVI